MKIAIPIISFDKAGGYRTLSRLATEWVNSGVDVDFIVCLDNPPYYPTIGNIILVNYKGNVVDKQCVKCKYHSKHRFCSIINYLKKTRNDYDAVLASHNITAVLAKLAKCRNIFYYIQAYEPEFYPHHNLKDFLKRKIAEKSYKLNGIVKIVNADIYKNYKKLKSKYIVPPGLDLSVYYSKDKIWDGQRSLIIGCIGRIEEWKGSQDVADAVDLLLNAGENIEFKVAFNPVNCKHDYELFKPDGDKNLSDYYRSVDVLVAPAKLQLGAIHYPVIEAMACGTTVITTGYYPANQKNSYIVPISNSSAIADAIKDIKNNFNLALEKAQIALKEIERFDWKIVSKHFMEIIESELKTK